MKQGNSKIEDYLNESSQIQCCKEELLKRIKRIKQKIDYVESNMDFLSAKSSKIQPEQKKTLKYIQTEFDIFVKILNKLRKQHLRQFDQTKSILIRNITNQITRFNRLIPANIQQNVMRSRLKNPVFVSTISESKKDKIQKPALKIQHIQKDEQAIVAEMMSKIDLFIKSTEENSTLTKLSLTPVMENSTSNKAQDSFKEQQTRHSQHSVQEVAEMQKQKERYWEYLRQQEKSKKGQKIKKVTKYVCLGLVITIIIIFLALTFVVYQILSLSGILPNQL